MKARITKLTEMRLISSNTPRLRFFFTSNPSLLNCPPKMLLQLLETLQYLNLHPAEKKKILQDEFDINMSRAFETEMSEMCNLSQGVWEKGVEKGREEGIQALVLSLQKFLKDQALVAKEVAGQFGLTQEAATKSVQQYWKN